MVQTKVIIHSWSSLNQFLFTKSIATHYRSDYGLIALIGRMQCSFWSVLTLLAYLPNKAILGSPWKACKSAQVLNQWYTIVCFLQNSTSILMSLKTGEAVKNFLWRITKFMIFFSVLYRHLVKIFLMCKLHQLLSTI